MKSIDARVSELANVFVRFSGQELGSPVSTEEVTQVVQDVLFGSRELWPALEIGIVTTEEVASALTAHVHERVFLRGGRSVRVQRTDWSDINAEVASVLASHR